MTQIESLNSLMPTKLNKKTLEYQAIFGSDPFTPESIINQSSDYNCGAIANELEYVCAYLDYITRTSSITDFYGEQLTRIARFFLGMVRYPEESDELFRTRFNSLVVRGGNTSWITKWMIRDVFAYFFDTTELYIIENYTKDTLIVDGSFEDDPALNWDVGESGSSTITWDTDEMFDGGFCAAFSVDSSGSNCYIEQTIPSVPEGTYVLSLFSKDDRAYSGDLFCIYIRRSSDSYYYNFETLTWQADAACLVVPPHSSIRYEIVQAFVSVDSGTAGDDLTIRFENVGVPSSAYTFYIDRIVFGEMLPNPSVMVLVVSTGLGESSSNSLALLEGVEDPVGGVDYTLASYFDQCFLIGWGTVGTLEYYMALLQLIKPAGVESTVVVVDRGV